VCVCEFWFYLERLPHCLFQEIVDGWKLLLSILPLSFVIQTKHPNGIWGPTKLHSVSNAFGYVYFLVQKHMESLMSGNLKGLANEVMIILYEGHISKSRSNK